MIRRRILSLLIFATALLVTLNFNGRAAISASPPALIPATTKMPWLGKSRNCKSG